jgi:ERCC4-type nuclease
MINAVIIDQREPTWIQSLTFGGVPTSVTILEQGDLLVAADDAMLCIERKTPDDLLSSIQDDRLFRQAANLTTQTPWAYLVITGSLMCSSTGHVITQRGETGWAWGAVQGALLTVQELGVGVIQTGSEQDYERIVLSLSNRDRSQLPLGTVRSTRFLSPGEAALAALPGIGIERLDELIKATGTVGDALAWLTRIGDKDRVNGIGEGICHGVRKALGLQDHEYLLVTSIPPTVKEK